MSAQSRAMAVTRIVACLAVAVAACACAPVPHAPVAVESGPAPVSSTSSIVQPDSLPRFRCDHDIQFTVRFADGAAQIDAGPQGSDTLLRDAGGVTPQQTVYSSTRMKAEFGLGAQGREAVLHYVSPPLEAHCTRD